MSPYTPLSLRKVARLTSVALAIREAGLGPGSVILEKKVFKPVEEVGLDFKAEQ